MIQPIITISVYEFISNLIFRSLDSLDNNEFELKQFASNAYDILKASTVLLSFQIRGWFRTQISTVYLSIFWENIFACIT